MYIAPHFREHRDDELARLVAAHPLGLLVVRGTEAPDAFHLPFEFDAHAMVLRAHVARANPLPQVARDGDAVLVVFRGPEAYVSPNWYPSKHVAHRQVPTWNYRAVHLRGTLRFTDDPKFLRGLLGRLTRTHEARAGEPRPWRMADAPPDYIDTLLGQIVGIEIPVTHMEGVSKLNQNKAAPDREGVMEALRARGDHALADAMRDAPVPPPALP